MIKIDIQIETRRKTGLPDAGPSRQIQLGKVPS